MKKYAMMALVLATTAASAQAHECDKDAQKIANTIVQLAFGKGSVATLKNEGEDEYVHYTFSGGFKANGQTFTTEYEMLLDNDSASLCRALNINVKND